MGPLNAPSPALVLALATLTALASLLRAWIRHRTAVRMEEEHTRRVQLAVEGSAKGQRAAVVGACAELEAASRAGFRPAGGSRAIRSP